MYEKITWIICHPFYRAVDCLNAGACDGGREELWASSGIIKSPGYDENSYPNYAHCNWIIRAAYDQVRISR